MCKIFFKQWLHHREVLLSKMRWEVMPWESKLYICKIIGYKCFYCLFDLFFIMVNFSKILHILRIDFNHKIKIIMKVLKIINIKYLKYMQIIVAKYNNLYFPFPFSFEG